jgi:hypothetical protein
LHRGQLPSSPHWTASDTWHRSGLGVKAVGIFSDNFTQGAAETLIDVDEHASQATDTKSHLLIYLFTSLFNVNFIKNLSPKNFCQT